MRTVRLKLYQWLEFGLKFNLTQKSKLAKVHIFIWTKIPSLFNNFSSPYQRGWLVLWDIFHASHFFMWALTWTNFVTFQSILVVKKLYTKIEDYSEETCTTLVSEPIDM